ncbi:hypothetical protein AXF42_Ash004999 [Apostasia shenzhenica]|uniref:Non-specific serine/threonine protein kinase n=1 Tax=Apostasia shenzhenica TaxID=1088818 RepID=A0A2I0B870_9ASPA|nr:hypothetical protein AXF42_Ash004999 [Apostasia shenzhenica]
MPRNRRRCLALTLCQLLIYAVRSDAGGFQPSDHGLQNEEDPGDPSPAMAAFFLGRADAPTPEAKNGTDPVWGVAGKVSPAKPASGGSRRLATLLVIGVICGFVGVGLLVASAVSYVVRASRSEQTAARSSSCFGPA